MTIINTELSITSPLTHIHHPDEPNSINGLPFGELIPPNKINNSNNNNNNNNDINDFLSLSPPDSSISSSSTTTTTTTTTFLKRPNSSPNPHFKSSLPSPTSSPFLHNNNYTNYTNKNHHDLIYNDYDQNDLENNEDDYNKTSNLNSTSSTTTSSSSTISLHKNNSHLKTSYSTGSNLNLDNTHHNLPKRKHSLVHSHRLHNILSTNNNNDHIDENNINEYDKDNSNIIYVSEINSNNQFPYNINNKNRKTKRSVTSYLKQYLPIKSNFIKNLPLNEWKDKNNENLLLQSITTSTSTSTTNHLNGHTYEIINNDLDKGEEGDIEDEDLDDLNQQLDSDNILYSNKKLKKNYRMNIMIRIMILLGMFIISSLFIWHLISGLPPMTNLSDDGKTIETIHIKVPQTFEQLKTQSSALSEYSKNNFWPVFKLLNVLFLFKQTFAIPGSTLANVLCGIVYGFWGFPLVTILTAIGSTSSYLLSKWVIGETIINKYARGSIGSLRNHVESNREKGSLFYYLLFLRLFPFSPNWFLNIASPFVGIPIIPFFLSILFGLMPYNYICIQAATTISSLNSFSDMLSLSTMLRLLSISVLALIPIFCGKAINNFIKTKINGITNSISSNYSSESKLISSNNNSNDLDIDDSDSIGLDSPV